MKENFNRIALFVLQQEVEPGHEEDGSLHNDPADPGGTTRFGLAQRSNPEIDLTKIDKKGALEVYRKKWWTEAHCDDLPWPLDLIAFDTAFNMGAGVANKLTAAYTDPNKYLWMRLLVYWKINKNMMKTSKTPKGSWRIFSDWIKRIVDLYEEASK